MSDLKRCTEAAIKIIKRVGGLSRFYEKGAIEELENKGFSNGIIEQAVRDAKVIAGKGEAIARLKLILESTKKARPSSDKEKMIKRIEKEISMYSDFE